jgi:hypothetical protein
MVLTNRHVGPLVVRYAYFKKLDYFSTECIYSPNAYRGYARAFLKDLEKVRPSAIMGMYIFFSNNPIKSVYIHHVTFGNNNRRYHPLWGSI